MVKQEWRRDGRGSVDDPVVRNGDKCAYEDCEEFAREDRATRAGYIVGYCQRHRLQAELVFDGALTASMT